MAALAIVFFTALSLNLFVNFGLGIREILARERTPAWNLCYPWIILFIVTALFWPAFALLLHLLGGVFNSILLFPLVILGSMGLEELLFYAFPSLGDNPRVFKAGSAYNGLSAASLALTLHFAFNFGEALLFSLAFSGGGLFTFLVIKEIQKRAILETVPRRLRGTPLVLLSMGLLSLIFSAVSALFLRIFL
ncbi:MAG: hypothetical protein LBG84_03890 [Treponema sp.]|jgi:electron transport complex protein RnfA|nr:hypothetical protein [Treponema sp.]